MYVFFYGLFMDEATLASKGIIPEYTAQGYVDGYELQVGERASLVQSPGARTHGILMEIAADEVKRLYAERSVADYLPETVTVELADNTRTQATCYNLPAHKITGTNRAYAKALYELADELGLEERYVGEIRRLAKQGD